jgi:hypothetical protein
VKEQGTYALMSINGIYGAANSQFPISPWSYQLQYFSGILIRERCRTVSFEDFAPDYQLTVKQEIRKKLVHI